MKDALRRMYGSSPGHPHGEDVFYYLTVYNEPIPQPASPRVDGLDEGHAQGPVPLQPGPGVGRQRRHAPRPAPGRGTAIQAALQAQELLAAGLGRGRRRLVRDLLDRASPGRAGPRPGRDADPGQPHEQPWVSRALHGAPGPVVAVTDYLRAVPDQIAQWVPSGLLLAGDRRLRPVRHPCGARRHFRVDAPSIAVAALAQLARRGEVKPGSATEAIRRYRLSDEPRPSAAEGSAAPAGPRRTTRHARDHLGQP